MDTQEITQVKKQSVFTKKRIIIASVILVLLVCLSVLSISLYVGFNLSQPERKEINQLPTDFGMNFYEEIEFQSIHDEITLKGWWIPAQSDVGLIESDEVIVFSHGYRDSRIQEGIEILDFARRLSEEGYHLLLFDYRQSGESGGEHSTIGHYETYDLLSSFQYIREEKGLTDIKVIGWSMGAVAAIHAVAEDKDVSVVVADSPFADLEGYLKENLSFWSKLPDFPFTSIILSTIPYISGADVNAVSPIRVVEDLGDNRLFLIHSKGDEATPYENSVQIYEKAGENAQLWLPEEAGHVRTVQMYPEEYTERVLEFLRTND